MFCRQCGTNLSDDAVFCSNCGAPVGHAPASGQEPPGGQPPSGPAQAPFGGQVPPGPAQGSFGGQVPPGPAQASFGGQVPPSPAQGSFGGQVPPKPPRKKGPWRLIALIGVGAAAVAGVAFLAINLLGGPKATLLNAVSASVSEYSKAAKSADLPDLNKLVESKKTSQRFSFELSDTSDIYSLRSLEGLGVRATLDADLPGKALYASVTPYYGSYEAMNLNLVMKDSEILLGCPEITGSTYYGVDTESLGSDLVRILEDYGTVPSAYRNISFNFFDLVESFNSLVEPDGKNGSTAKDMAKKLLSSLEVTKAGKETVEINGNDVTCTAYHVLFQVSALEGLVDDLEESMDPDRIIDGIRDILKELGIPDSELRDLDRLDTSDISRAFDELRDALDDLDDIEFDAYVKGGRIMSIVYETRISGERVVITLNLGGGDRYVDDLSLEINVSGSRIIIASTGDHSGKSGTITDKTELRIRANGINITPVKSTLSYEPKAKSDNFSWKLEVSTGYTPVSLNVKGQITTTRDSIDLDLNKVKLEADGDSVTVKAGYYLGPYSKNGSDPKKKVMPLESRDIYELRDTVEDLAGDVRDWLSDVTDEIPALSDVYYYLRRIF